MTPPEGEDDPPATPAAADEPQGTVPLRKLRRTQLQRATIVATVLTTVVCFLGAGALVFGQQFVERRQTAGFENRADGDGTAQQQGDADGDADDVVTDTTFPEADPDAKNFLITGADNGECVDPDSEFAGAFGGRSGERSDTIMIWRIDPGTRRAATLSLPRDLWVTRASTGGEGRINSEYRRDNPQDLVYTINDNFDIYIDHFIQVDFCAFKELVDAVGGVEVPFEYRARDTRSGLDTTEPGCHNFDGDHALAYVRSRYYEVLPPGADPNDDHAWERDPTSDRGRITRQQDFLRRLLNDVLDRGILNPSVVQGLYRSLTDFIVTDPDLTLQRILEFAGVAEHIDPQGIPTYQFVAEDAEMGGQSVLMPAPEAAGMPEVLDLFQGERSLGRLPDAPDDDATPATTEAAPDPGPTAAEGTEPGDSGESEGPGGHDGPDDEAAPAGAEPPDDPEVSDGADDSPPSAADDEDRPDDIQYGMHPDPDATCD